MPFKKKNGKLFSEKKNGKSSQVNILILDFYLLELSKYKQMKKKF